MSDVSSRLTYGPVQIGGHISSVLWGAMCVQTYTYAVRSKDDHALLKGLVAVMFCLETVLTAILWVLFYEITVVQDLDPHWMPKPSWMILVVEVLPNILSALVQVFFAYRIRMMSGRLSLAVFSWVLILVRLALTAPTVVAAAGTSLLLPREIKYQGMVYVTFGLSILVDLWNTIVLCWYLWRARRIVMKQTSSRLRAIFTLTLETGVVILIVDLFVSICWAAMRFSGLAIFGVLVYARIYANALLLSLNARKSNSSAVATSTLTGASQHPRSSIMQFSPARGAMASTVESSYCPPVELPKISACYDAEAPFSPQ